MIFFFSAIKIILEKLVCKASVRCSAWPSNCSMFSETFKLKSENIPISQFSDILYYTCMNSVKVIYSPWNIGIVDGKILFFFTV